MGVATDPVAGARAARLIAFSITAAAWSAGMPRAPVSTPARDIALSARP